MADKKILNEEQLEKVNGGLSGYYMEHKDFIYGIGDRIDIHSSCFLVQFTKGMRVKKLGYFPVIDSPYDQPCYYLEAIKPDEADYNGWYDQYTMDVNHNDSTWPKLDADLAAKVVPL